ncbi:MAG: acetyltransferase, partial [Nannocystaceae bacterium]|nr:acetyltransferase [Nannocystaceae bacterium]
LLRDTSILRVVVEPDVRNEKIRRLNKIGGFEEVREVDLRGSSATPAKTAMLSVCTREDYRRARAKEFAS